MKSAHSFESSVVDGRKYAMTIYGPASISLDDGKQCDDRGLSILMDGAIVNQRFDEDAVTIAETKARCSDDRR